MGSILRLDDLATMPGWGEEVVIKYYGHWRRFVDGLRTTRRAEATRPALAEDAEVFEVRFAEGDARVEFDAAMEVWAGRVDRQPQA